MQCLKIGFSVLLCLNFTAAKVIFYHLTYVSELHKELLYGTHIETSRKIYNKIMSHHFQAEFGA